MPNHKFRATSSVHFLGRLALQAAVYPSTDHSSRYALGLIQHGHFYGLEVSLKVIILRWFYKGLVRFMGKGGATYVYHWLLGVIAKQNHHM